MAVIERFEEFVAWQRACDLNKQIYAVTRNREFARDRALVSQMRRASVSVMANIAEGFERGSRAEFHHALTIAKGSCAEVRALLYAALDANYLEQKQFDELQKLGEETSRIIGGLRVRVAEQ